MQEQKTSDSGNHGQEETQETGSSVHNNEAEHEEVQDSEPEAEDQPLRRSTRLKKPSNGFNTYTTVRMR